MIQFLSVVALAAWIFAFVNTLLNLLLIRRIRSDAPAAGPLVSIVIPARNEEGAIEATVRSFLAQRYRNLEIIVVNDRSTDATGPLLDRLATGEPRLAVIHGDHPPEGWLGKPWAMHQGARRAKGELLLFVDADLVYSPDAVAGAAAELQSSESAMITLLPHIRMKGFWEQVAMPMLAFAFFTMLPSWLANRTGIVRLGLGGGTGNLIRRDIYERVDGHETLRDAVVDDIGLARLVRRHGGRTLTLRADHLIALRMYRGGREILDGFTKNMFAALGRSYGAAVFFLGTGLICNILPYGLALTGDVAAMSTVGLISLTRLMLFGSLRYRLDNALLAHPLMLSFWGWVLLRSVWVTGIRGQLRWRGRSYEAGLFR